METKLGRRKVDNEKLMKAVNRRGHQGWTPSCEEHTHLLTEAISNHYGKCVNVVCSDNQKFGYSIKLMFFNATEAKRKAVALLV